MMGEKEGYMLEMIEYIKKNLKKGYTKESLKWALIRQGYSRMEVEKAMKMVDQYLAVKAPALETKPEIKYEAIAIDAKNSNGSKKSLWKKLFG